MNYLAKFQQANGLAIDGMLGKETARVMMSVLKIPSAVAFCHFIGQIAVESGNFSAGRENLNYSTSALQKLFGKYFKGVGVNDYARQPEKIANRIYCNRMGNGNEASGDGWKYRGIGSLQMTGKSNVELYLKSVGLPLNTDPDSLLTGNHYFGTAKFFYDINNIWKYCSKSDASVLTVSKFINLGSPTAKAMPLGLDERMALTKKYFNLLA
jgi:putative chitinase